MEFFSRPIAQVNKQFFKMLIATKLPDEIRVMIKEISDNKEPYCDHYGRVTYFYMMLGTEILPVYQPGSVMFETAVKEESDIAIF